ncbi:MAG: hypothetical protein SGARI_000384, partial [Bacillariaceae sp.]
MAKNVRFGVDVKYCEENIKLFNYLLAKLALQKLKMNGYYLVKYQNTQKKNCGAFIDRMLTVDIGAFTYIGEILVNPPSSKGKHSVLAIYQKTKKQTQEQFDAAKTIRDSSASLQKLACDASNKALQCKNGLAFVLSCMLKKENLKSRSELLEHLKREFPLA